MRVKRYFAPHLIHEFLRFASTGGADSNTGRCHTLIMYRFRDIHYSLSGTQIQGACTSSTDGNEDNLNAMLPEFLVA